MNFPDAKDLFLKTIERKYEKELTMIYDKINFSYLHDSFDAKIEIKNLDIQNINLSEIITYLNMKNYTTNYDSFYLYFDWSHDA